MPAFVSTGAAGVDSGFFALALMLALAMAAAAAFAGQALRQHKREARHLRLIAGLRDEISDLKGTAAARDRAEAANEAKSRFLATVSHEVRTPLNGILGMADLMSGTPLSAEQKSYLDSIRTSGEALASLIDEILDFSRIEAGKLDLERKPFDLHALVEGVVELLAPRAQGKGLEIASSIAADAPQQVAGDAQRLRQVLLNLAGNAVKFTEAGGVGVRVLRDGAGRLRFSVADTGPGVPLAQRETIFAEFEQGDNVGALGGAGLGLAISSRLVAAMGGTLRLDSPPGGGAAFSFAITLPDAGPAASRPSALGQLVGRRALIIAQSPFEAPWLGERLADAGAQVRTIAGEAAALDALGDLTGEGPTPDIVIVDCALGAEAAARLAAAARAAGVARSLVLFSPFERRALGEQATQGFDGWLTKPVRRHSLLARLEESIAAENAWRDPVEAPPRPGEGLSVLIAEDNDINALLCRRIVEKLGHRPVWVKDGRAAVATALDPAAGIDLVLMDMQMPDCDGLSAAKMIRAGEGEGRRLPIIALTANAFAEDRAAAIAAGMDSFLTKPLDRDRLVEAIDQYVAVTRQAPGRAGKRKGKPRP